jgi:helix-turn-helix protein
VRLAVVMARSVLLDHAAQILGVCRRTIYYRIREGRLVTIRTVGGSQRVLLESIEALLREEREERLERLERLARDRGAGASGTGPSGKSRAP